MDRHAWEQPGAHEEAPGIYRIALPLPGDHLKAVNVYAVADGEQVVMIDGGWALANAEELLTESLAQIGYSLSDVREFLVTHVHRDHYTQAIVVRREFGARVGLGIGEKPTLDSLQSPDRSPLMGQVEHLYVLGAPDLAETISGFVRNARPDFDQWESPDDWLEPGELPLPGGRVLEAVHTPGHTSGHLVFHDLAGGLLVAGDHVLPTITPSIGLEPALSPNPLGDFHDSLTLVRSRPDAMLLPAHGPVAASVHARVDELTAHHGRRLDEVEAAVRRGATTAYDVARQLRWTRRGRSLDELDVFNQMLAIGETGAHLELLVVQGRLHAADDDGVRHYDAS
jgi:glyoxylase-like metal-dependent hydrolase (beta-lactamase superfamily II)